MRVVSDFDSLGLVRYGRIELRELDPADLIGPTVREAVARARIKLIESDAAAARRLCIPPPDLDTAGHWELERQRRFVAVEPKSESLVQAAIALIKDIRVTLGPARVWWTAGPQFVSEDSHVVNAYRATGFPVLDPAAPVVVVLGVYFFHEFAGLRWHEAAR